VVHEASIISSQGSSSKPVSRLLVVTDIHPKLDIETAQKAIQKTCGLYGGLYRDQLYLPVRESEVTREDSVEPEIAEKEKKEDTAISKTPSSTSPEQESTATASSSSEATPTRPTHQLIGHAVVELCSSGQVSSCSSSLLGNPALQLDDSCPQVTGVSNSLKCGEDELPNQVLAEYLRKKLMQDATSLEDSAKIVLSLIFRSSLAKDKSGVQLEVAKVTGELMQFLNSFAEGCGVSAEEQLESIKKSHGNEQGHVSLEGFLDWVMKQMTEDVGVRCVWLGLLAAGYDLHFEK
jgi:E3 ubiquitin-protein ligase HECTD4